MLRGDRILLRLARADDAVEVARFYRENNAFFALTQTPKSEDWCDESWWVRQAATLQDDFRNDRSCQLFSFSQTDGSVIGAIGLSAFVRGVFQACYLGYLLAERAQGQGLMHESLKLTIAYAFDELNLHRVMANFAPTNVKSGRVLRRLGFRIEGYAERYLMINGVWTDHFLTSLTNDAWQASEGGSTGEATSA